MRKAAAILASGITAGTALGCVSSAAPSSGEDETGDQLLRPDQTGWVDATATGTTGIQGQWRAFGASSDAGRVEADGCPTDVSLECSMIIEPRAGSPYAPTRGLGMCTSGRIARWIAGSNGLTPDGSPGSAGIVFDLNVPGRGTSLGAQPGRPYDADAHRVTGFAFELDSEPAAGTGMTVVLTRAGSELAWPATTVSHWKGSDGSRSPVHAGLNEFRWDEIAPGPFDSSTVVGIAFLANGSDAHATSYAFCIDRLTALRPEPEPAEVARPPPPASTGQLLVPDETGWVDRSTTGATKIQGSWFSSSDVDDCQRAGHAAAECSVVTDPPGGGVVLPNRDLGVCTAGIAAQTQDPGIVWGALLAFDLNAADPPDRGSSPYDARTHGVSGIAFDIDSEPPPGAEIQVQVAHPGQEARAPWWGGEEGAWSPVHAGYNEFRWEDVGGPYWIEDETERVPLDATKLQQLRFQVSSNEHHSVSYRFCITRLMALEQ